MIKPHVLHLINNFNIGGAERFLLKIIKGVDSVTQSVACYSRSGRLLNEFESVGLNLYEIAGGSRPIYNPKRFKQVTAIATLIREKKVNILHSHLTPSLILGPLAAQKTKVVSVASVHAKRDQLKFIEFAQTPIMKC